MVQSCESEVRPGPAEPQPAGRYVYCLAPGEATADLGPIGIGGCAVYSFVHRGLCSVVHACPPQPYQSEDADVLAAWALAHHRVVEAAWKRWGVVLPLTFNTIIAPHETGAEAALAGWLEREHDPLTRKLDALAGKAEYVFQVFWDCALLSEEVAQATPAIGQLNAELGSLPRGRAYMYRQNLERLLRRELEARTAEQFRAVYQRLSLCAEGIKVEKPGHGAEGPPMLMNLSCLVSTERLPDLQAEVQRISGTPGYLARLAGPLPPYSFC